MASIYEINMIRWNMEMEDDGGFLPDGNNNVSRIVCDYLKQ